MKVHNIHLHRLSDGGIAFTVQMEDNGKIEPFVHEIELAELAWLARQSNQMIYEDVSK